MYLYMKNLPPPQYNVDYFQSVRESWKSFSHAYPDNLIQIESSTWSKVWKKASIVWESAQVLRT